MWGEGKKVPGQIYIFIYSHYLLCEHMECNAQIQNLFF